jgi:hypothetical protein
MSGDFFMWRSVRTLEYEMQAGIDHIFAQLGAEMLQIQRCIV